MPTPSIDEHIVKLGTLADAVRLMQSQIAIANPIDIARMHALATALSAEIQISLAIAQLIIASSYLDSRWSDK